MTAKEKAKQLVDKFQFILTEKQFGKECALVAVNEILGCSRMNDDEQVKYSDGTYAREYYEVPNKFWTQVKHEIEKL